MKKEQSKRPDNRDFSHDKLAADLNAVIGFSKAKDPVLWGHSMGGFTILTFFKEYAYQLHQIKGIILEHTTYTNPIKTSMMRGLLQKIQNPVLKPLCWIMIVLAPLFWLIRFAELFEWQ